MRLVLTLSVVLLVAGGTPAAAQALAALEAEAAAALGNGQEAFPRRVALVERLRGAAERAPAREQRGRLTLLWLRGVRWLLDAVPFGRSDEQPYRAWLMEHETLVVYSEPAGQWLINPETMSTCCPIRPRATS